MAESGATGSRREKVMTSEEVSEYLKIPISSVWGLTRKGRIRAVKIGKHWRYLESDVKAFLLGSVPRTSTAPKISERRKFPRINCAILSQFQITLPNQKEINRSVSIQNLSEAGAFLVCGNHQDKENVECRIGDPVKVTFEIQELQDEKIELQGRIVHRTVNGKVAMGMKFRLMQDEIRKVIRDYVG